MPGCSLACQACRRLQCGSEHLRAAVLSNTDQTLASFLVLFGISHVIFLLCRDHGGSRYLLLSAHGVFVWLSLPEGMDVLERLTEEMLVIPLNECLCLGCL